MAITGNFSQVPLQGLILSNGNELKNPTSLQFGPDGRLYVSSVNGTIAAANIEKIDNAYQVVGDVEEITLVKDIPNHDDDGTLNLSENKRQITGLVVDTDDNGNTVIYVSSSDPRRGAGPEGIDENLDTNSGILTRLTLTNPNAPVGNNRWEKTDLVIGLPRSEENHSTNGLDIRTEDVDGEARKIMYVAQGGHTNKGGPARNFVFQPEYYYAGAILRVDLTQLEATEADIINTQGALKGGTDYADKYVYALPTLNDPTRADAAEGRDTAVGTTGAADVEAGDTFGGNNGRNQAKYDADGPVQIYSPGYRNQYDVVITENDNMYTFDNGPNNGWGDVPITDSGVVVNLDDADPTNDVASNRPNLDVDTGKDKDPDNLHLVTEGFYAGLPNPTRASGSAAGLYSTDDSGPVPVVTKLTLNNGTPTLEDDLPVDWDEITGGFTNPIEGVYKAPGESTDGSTKGEDGALLTIGTSSNGLTEYTASGLSDSTNPNTEVLIVASFNNDLTFIEVESDGTQAGSSVVDTKAFNVGGGPLDVTAVGDQGIDNNGKFAGTVWTGLYGLDTILILEPSSGPPVIDNDQDDDGLTDEIDHLQYDPNNGTQTVLEGGETLFWDFNPAEGGVHPGKGTPAEGVFNIGFTGWQTNGVDDLYLDPDDPGDDQLTNLNNTIRGGAPGIIQVKEVGGGDNDLALNNQKDAIQTGFLPRNDVKDFTIIVPIFNPFSSDANNGLAWTSFASVGISLGDGSQSNFVEISVGAKGPSDIVLKVVYEENDGLVQEIELDNLDFLLNATEGGQAVDDDQIELRLNVNMNSFQLTPEWRYQLSGEWSAIEQVGSSPIQLDVDGNIVQALQGQYINNGVQSSPVVSLLSSSRGPVDEFTADYLELTIESTKKQTAAADLSLTQQVSDISPSFGDVIALNLTLNNAGPDKATGVSVQDLLPAGLDYISDDSGGSYNASTGLWSVGSVASGSSATLSIQADVTEVTSGDALYRVNVGGGEIAAADGSTTVWEADTDLVPSPYRVDSGGNKARQVAGNVDASSPTLPFGTPGGIFLSERTDPLSNPNMLWDFAVLPGTEVEVRLYFAELFNKIDAPGKRVFDVSVEGSVPSAFNDIDPFAIAGNRSGFMLSDTVTVSDGVLNLEFLHDTQRTAITGIEIIDLSGELSYSNYAQVLTADQADPDSTPGNDSTNEDDDITKVIKPNQGVSNLAAIALTTNGAEPDQNGQFTVSLAESAATDTIIDYSVSGDATADGDYTALSGSVTILAGETTGTIDIEILDDTIEDPDETLIVTLEGIASGDSDIAVGANNEATMTIADDEIPPENEVAIAAISNGAEPNSDGQFTVSLEQAVATNTTLSYTVGGSATSGSDYATLPGTVTIQAGELTANIDVDVFDDNDLDPDETVTVSLTGITNGSPEIVLGGNSSATVTIADDEVVPAIADLSLIQTISDSTPEIGDDITLTLTVSNNGPNGATGVNVQDLLPAGFSYISDDANGAYNPTTGQWKIGSVATGGSATLNIQAIVTEIAAGDTLYRINVGGGEVTDGSSLAWAADTSTDPSPNRIGSGGIKARTVSRAIGTSSPTIPGGTPATIFRSERSDPFRAPNMLWDFAVAPGSEVEVRLYFAELFNKIDTVGKRVFDVAVEGSVPTVFDDIDPFAIAGNNSGFMLSDTVIVSDGLLNLEFLHEDQRPVVSGIEIINLSDGGSTLSSDAYTNYAQISASDQADPDSTPGDDSIGDDDDDTVIGFPGGGSTVNNTVSVAGTANGSEPDANGLFTVNLSKTATTDTVVAYSVGGSATAGSDFTALSGSVTIPAGQLSASIDVLVTDDSTQEPTENVLMTLSGITSGDDNVVVGTSDQATITIGDDDEAFDIGSAIFSINENSNNVKISNFGSNSFLLTNTGNKKIAQVDVDVTNALYPDTVFDPFAIAGDSASKELTINANGGTGVVAPSSDSLIGEGGTAGFKGLQLVFDEAVNGGFETGETLGFSIDMDSNSLAGGNKNALNAGSSPSWDVGGVSGAELIGSSFTVIFTDGSTADGQLQGNNNQGGAKGLAAQDSPNISVNLAVNGLQGGGIGTYSASGPSVVVDGPAGQTARVVLTKGFIQPVTAPTPEIQAQLDELAATDFPANNAVEFQTVDVVLTGSPQDISNQFDFSGVANFNFTGEAEVPLGFVASAIDPTNGNLPLGPVTEPIYLQFADSLTLDGAPTQGGELLAQAELTPVVEAAIDYWAQQGASDSAIATLETVDVLIGDLGGTTLGEADGLVKIDDDAAGYGWSTSLDEGLEVETDRVDLFSVIAHEFGHILGLDHSILGETLGVGERQLPIDLDDLNADWLSEVSKENLSMTVRL